MRNVKVTKAIVEQIKRKGKTDLEPFWKSVKTQNKNKQGRITIRNEVGERIEDQSVIKEMYKEHYTKLLTPKKPVDIEEIRNEALVVQAIKNLQKISNLTVPKETTRDEIIKEITSLKLKKAKDSEGWQNEHLVYGGEEMALSLQKIYSMADVQQQIPDSWERMWIKSIFKEKNARTLEKTRGLFMTNIVAKLKEKIIKTRNEEEWEKSASPYQCGGKKGTSTIDHTLTILETIQRQKYLNKPTYILYIDLEKCFDKLWLEDGVVELWRSGMNPLDAYMVYRMNQNANITIMTPAGETSNINVKNVVKQGTIYGPRICNKVVERVNNINERAITHYSPNIELQSLQYVDDITGLGSKQTVETIVRNVRTLEIKKKATVKLSKSGYMIITTSKNQKVEEIKGELRNGRLERRSEYKYLGTWLNEKGNCDLNIRKKIEQTQYVIKKVESMASSHQVGNLATSMKIELYKTVVLPTLLYNMEAFGNIKPEEMQKLEKYQGEVLRRLTNMPKSTVYLGLLQELGVWKIKDMMLYKKIMLLHNIVTSKDERIIKKIINEQDKNPIPNCWLDCLKKQLEEIGMTTDLKEIKRKTKKETKNEAKKKIEEKLIQQINKNATTKMRTVIKTNFGKKKYIDEGELNEEETKEALKVRLHMKNYKANYKGSSSNLSCRFCQKVEETTEHIIMECEKLCSARRGLKLQEGDLEKDDSKAIRRVVKMSKRVDMIM